MSTISVKLKDPTGSLSCQENGIILFGKGVFKVTKSKKIATALQSGRLIEVKDDAAEAAAKKAEAEAAAKAESEAKAKEAEAQKAAEAAAKKAEAEAAKPKKEADKPTEKEV